MKIERKDTNGVTILRLVGDIDENGLDVLRVQFYELSAEGRNNIVLNMAGVRFILYISVGYLVELVRKVRTLNGDIRITTLPLYGQRLFRIVGVSLLFQLFETESDAVSSFVNKEKGE